jgi:hypothetical protein
MTLGFCPPFFSITYIFKAFIGLIMVYKKKFLLQVFYQSFFVHNLHLCMMAFEDGDDVIYIEDSK